MNNTNNSLGFFIPNSDYIFQAKNLLSRDDLIFVITIDNEILVMKKVDNLNTNISELENKFILFTHPQTRSNIFDIFIMNLRIGIINNPDKKIIVSISENLILNFWNKKDGLCISKINLSNYKRKGETLLNVFNINRRFLLFIFLNKSILFDCCTLVIIKEEKLNFNIKKVYQIKENKFYLLTEIKDTYLMEIQNINIEKEFNYEEIRYRIIKHTFRIDKVFNEETIFTLFSHQEFLFHNFNQMLKVSSLDSVEELTEFSNINSDSKFKIIFLDIILIDEEEFLIAIYKDLTCELFTYDKKVREIRKHRKFMIMIEDEFLNMNYIVNGSLLIGYVENFVHVLDLKRTRIPNEKYVDKTINLSNIFGKKSKKLSFTNYFCDNFQEYCKYFFDNINNSPLKIAKDFYKQEECIIDSAHNKSQSDVFKITASTIYSNPENKSIYNIIGTNTGKVAIIDIFFNESLGVNPLILIDYHTSKINNLYIIDNKYLITSSEDGVITFTDISNEKIRTALNEMDLKVSVNKNSYEEEYEKNISSMNYYYSKRKSLSMFPDKLFISKNILLHSDKNTKNKMKVINLLPIHTIKNYNKLKRILNVIQLDNYQLTFDDNFKRKYKNLLAFELEDNSIMIINIDELKTLYTFNLNSKKNSTKAIYHISYERCLILYMDNNTIRVCNYSTKTTDRVVTDINKIFNILMVEEKLKIYFINPENILEQNFKINYEYNENKKAQDNNQTPKESLSKNNVTGFQSNYEISSNQTYQSKSMTGEITLEFIRENLTNEYHKKLFIEKYIHTAFRKKKYHLNKTQNKFESNWMKKIENLIIDEIFEIINSFNMIDKLKKISIMNLLFNPTINYKIVDRYDLNNFGIEGNLLKIGNQINEYLSINFEDYFMFIEKTVHENKNSTVTNRINYYNFISLFHIWNISIDQDINIINFLKIYQPIFEFNFILNGCDSALSLILNRESEVDGDLAGQFNFLIEYMKSDENKIKQMKNEKYCNKSYLVKSQQGYLTNLKNYKCSLNLSHLLNLSLFGSLIAVLGFEESNDLCRLIASEKFLYKNLSQQKFILFTNLLSIDKYMYETNDDITLANKDLLLYECLSIKYNTIKTSSNESTFLQKLNNIIEYLEYLYMYIFNLDNKQEHAQNFYKYNKDKNIENSKLTVITEFDLSLINIIITYNALAEEKFDESRMIKTTELLVIFVFKILNPNYILLKTNFSKIIVELLSKCVDYLEKVYAENITNYAKFMIDLYSSVKIPIDLDGLFKKYEIGNCIIIKSEDNYNFLKIMLAKHLKVFSKNNISFILKIIVEEFKRKTLDVDYSSYMLEILWILFREKNFKYINFLPPLIHLIMSTISPQNKEMRTSCLDNAKKVLSCLLPNYPMISFHQNSQKLAVGANDGKIYIYDLTSGNIWKNLNAHTNEITALSFDFTGNILISYSSTEFTVKFWKIGLTNFFSNFFSMKDGYYKSSKFPVINQEIKPEDKVNYVKFQLMPKNDNKVVLIREDKSVEVLSL